MRGIARRLDRNARLIDPGGQLAVGTQSVVRGADPLDYFREDVG